MTKTEFWKDIKRLENLFYIFNIFILIIITILNVFKFVSVEVLISTVSYVLSSTILLLVILHNSVRKFQEQWKSPGIGDIFKRFRTMEDEIRLNINNADEIWLLSRTGGGWFNNFDQELNGVINNNNNNNNHTTRLLLLDPDNGALRMVRNACGTPLNNFEFSPGNLWANAQVARDNLNHMRHAFAERIDLRVIDHLPAWTLLIINPSRNNSETIIYVELATYTSNPRQRPIFKVTRQDMEYFDLFIDEFENMWENAKPWRI
jgi:hypothetical protein